jgi:ABC-type antimicrobial peptide transport system permease subunit
MREMGVRVALGAARHQVLGLVLRQATGLVAVGIALGMAAAFAGARYLEGMVYGAGTRDPATFALVALLLATVGAAASLAPARRAAGADPLEALRAE